MSWQDKGLEQIDRPVIRFAKKIHKDSLDVGKGCLVSSNVSDDAKRKLIETDRKINTGYKLYYSVLLVIAVAVSLAVMVTCIFVSTDFISGLQISMIIELVIWCPGIFCDARIVSLLRKNQVHIFRYDVIMNVQILKELYRWTVANIAIHK